MAISLKTAGTWARMVTDGGTVAIPGSPAAGDRMFLFGSWKTYTITVADPNGWNLIDDFSDGAVAAGNGSGSVHNAVWYRDWQSGDAAPVIDYSAAPTEGHWVIMLWQKGAGDLWGDPLAVHAGITAVDPWSATASATVDVPDASVVMSLVGLRDDSTTIARVATTAIGDDGSPAVSWNGNYVESPATHFNSTTGFDMSGDLGHRFVTTGAAGVSLTSTGDPAAAETGTVTWIVQGLGVAPSGTSAITVPAATTSGVGAEGFTATGAVSVPAATVAGTGAEGFTATSAVTVPAATTDGIGDHTLAEPTATSAISAPAATVAATGELGLTATGAITAPTIVISAPAALTFTAVSDISVASGTVDATGVHAAPVMGTSAISGQPSLVAGAGLHIQNATGTGAITVPSVTVAGAGSGGVTESPYVGGGFESRRPPRLRLRGPTQVLLLGSSGVRGSAPQVSGVGVVNDDELVLRLL